MRSIACPIVKPFLALMAAGSVLANAGRADTLLTDQPPTFLPFSYPPDGSHMMGDRPSKPGGYTTGATPGITAPLVPPSSVAPTSPPPVQTHAEILDELFHRLAAAADGEEASGVAARIQQLWLDSGSDTADLLMSRAAAASGKGNTDLALGLLDKIVVLEPDWAEGWNRRATLRFQQGDDDGSMADIGHVLKLEPRHFGALSGMAVIFQRHGLKKDALMLLRKAAEIYPRNDDLKSMIETLTPEVEGRAI